MNDDRSVLICPPGGATVDRILRGMSDGWAYHPDILERVERLLPPRFYGVRVDTAFGGSAHFSVAAVRAAGPTIAMLVGLLAVRERYEDRPVLAVTTWPAGEEPEYLPGDTENDRSRIRASDVVNADHIHLGLWAVPRKERT